MHVLPRWLPGASATFPSTALFFIPLRPQDRGGGPSVIISQSRPFPMERSSTQRTFTHSDFCRSLSCAHAPSQFSLAISLSLYLSLPPSPLPPYQLYQKSRPSSDQMGCSQIPLRQGGIAPSAFFAPLVGCPSQVTSHASVGGRAFPLTQPASQPGSQLHTTTARCYCRKNYVVHGQYSMDVKKSK